MTKLTIAVVLAAAPFAALSDNGLAQKVVAPAKDAPKPEQRQAAKAVRLSDAELDKVTAGSATHFTGEGFTIVRNNGNASFLKFHKNLYHCINC